MTAAVLPVQRDLAGLFRDALERAAASGDIALDPAAIPEPALERPRLPEHGDWATNVALTLAKAAKAPPRAIAEAMVAHLDRPDWVAGVEVAGPGFVNVRLDQRWFAGLVRRIVAEGDSFGTIDLGHGEAVNVEFISANPTGPLHVGNARLAPMGDALANLLAATGHKVEREYYFNDAGTQIDLLGASVEAAYLGLLGRPAEPPEDGYKGAYVAETARDLLAEQGDALAELDPAARRAAVTDWSFRRMLDGIRQTLARLGVSFDVWFSERTLHETGAIAQTVEDLRERGVVEERDGAVWLRTTQFGDDKDRPLIRSNGQPTYFGADAAYYRDKRRRGFDKLIFLWGADHHGYVPRMRAVVRAFGDPDDTAEFVISQLVSLVRAGQPAKMSKRAGDIATVDDLIDEVGKDPFRYTMLRYSVDAPIEFDVEAVTRQSMDNPVYYVQYAHARISSVLRQGQEIGFTALPAEEADLGLLVHPMEAALLRRLAGYEELVVLAAVQRAPHRLTRYAEDLAAAFHRFYGECRVLTDDQALSSARWWLVTATRQVLANTLGLIGVDAPERM
ncbi:MAG TPA: arginine--tRNA ligase [Actinomycetota bacterium]|jgi:arginyl-tRNA synthetase|nr:arginine--tRNA ligase [Actinomycetota bacterium]